MIVWKYGDEWLTWVSEVFRSGQGLPLLAVFVVLALALYLAVLLLTLLIPIWRWYRSPH